MKYQTLRYRVSTDGGRTYAVDEPIIQKGDYTPEHPLEYIWFGKNGVMNGDRGSRTIFAREGRILVPVQITPLGPNGKMHNPGGGSSYHESVVLIGTWKDDLRIEWDVSERVANDPAKSTRGACEPTLAEMPDGRILMVVRGSNDAKPHLPGYKWYAVSQDGGRHWTKLRPWTYTDGTNFFSPSSCSQLLKHSNGRYYWLGNITPQNPKGNLPRDPFVIGQVDPESLLLIKETVAIVDASQPGQGSLYLSNFLAQEDRETGEILLYMMRREKSMIYRIAL